MRLYPEVREALLSTIRSDSSKVGYDPLDLAAIYRSVNEEGPLYGPSERERGPRETGIISGGARGAVAGVMDIEEAVGRVGQYLGIKFKSPWLERQGKEIAETWQRLRTPYETPEDLQGSIIDNPELAGKGAWWTYHLMRTAPSLVASLVPGLGVSKLMKAPRVVKVLGTTLKLTPKTIERLARVGAALGTGVTGGMLEGGSTLAEAEDLNASPEEMAAAFETMTLASAALNALSADRMIRAMPSGLKKKVTQFLVGGLTEMVTEYAEEPTEAGILLELGKISKEQAIERTKRGANVLPIAFALGATGAGAAAIAEGKAAGAEEGVKRYEKELLLTPTGAQEWAAANPELAERYREKGGPTRREIAREVDPQGRWSRSERERFGELLRQEAESAEEMVVEEIPAKREPKYSNVGDWSTDEIRAEVQKAGYETRGMKRGEMEEILRFQDEKRPAEGIWFRSPPRPAPGEPTGMRPPEEADVVPKPPEPDQAVIELPEVVRMAQDLLGGKIPLLKRVISGLRSIAGAFYPKQAKIALMRDIFKGPVIRDTELFTSRMIEDGEIERIRNELANEHGVSPEDIIVKNEPHKKGKSGLREVTYYLRDPNFAAKILAHELGHAVDWLPEGDLSRGNILGRIASLKRYLKDTLEGWPGGPERLT
ncbi:MAG: hypothetical protein DRJ03_29895, partial [Chloroflexi bacterium]